MDLVGGSLNDAGGIVICKFGKREVDFRVVLAFVAHHVEHLDHRGVDAWVVGDRIEFNHA